MSKVQRLLLRSVIALIIGHLILGISLNAAWKQAQQNFIVMMKQKLTLQMMSALQQDLQNYYLEHGKLPDNFRELPVVEREPSMFMEFQDRPYLDQAGKPWDAWGHEIVCQVEQGKVSLLSYGQDGQPGGLGLDYDFSPGSAVTKSSQLTFCQFLENKSTSHMITNCVVISLLTSLLTFRIVNSEGMKVEDLFGISARVLLILVSASFIGSIMALVHAPNGH